MTTGQVLNLLLHKFRVSSDAHCQSECCEGTTSGEKSLFVCLFQVENKPDEFVLYMVHESGGESKISLWWRNEKRCVFICEWPAVFFVCDLSERTRLRDDEYPLVARVLYGPCEKISKILVTEADLGEEVTYDVSLGLAPPLHMLFHSLCGPQRRLAIRQWTSFRNISCFGSDATIG